MARYSNSLLQTYQKCPLQCFYKYEKHLQQIGDDASGHHLAYGRACHEAFRVLYTENDVKKAQDTLRENYPVQLDPADLAKTADNGCFMIGKYWKHYNGDPDWEIVEVEQMDSAEDGFVVKPDLLVKDRSGSIWIVDHKFSGRYLNYDFFNEFSPNSQITQYIKQVREKWGECSGFIVNAVGMRYRQRAYKGEPAGFWISLERQVFNCTPQQIAQDDLAKNYWIERIEESRKTGLWPMNTASCRFCSYRPICSSGWDWDNDSELILNTMRQVCEKWIPETGAHCNLDLGHAGDHDFVLSEVTEAVEEFEVTV